MKPCSLAATVLLAAAGFLPTAGCSDVSGSGGGQGLTVVVCAGDAGGAGNDDAGGGDDAGDDSAAADEAGASPCAPPDSDRLIGGCYAFDLTVDDTGFSNTILKAQNVGQVTITLTNAGTTPHDLVVDCMPIQAAGCPPQWCFPASANIAPVAPGATASTTFVTPFVEGTYDFRSDVGSDSQSESDGGLRGLWGQFLVQ
jgi:hypothetical protein